MAAHRFIRLVAAIASAIIMTNAQAARGHGLPPLPLALWGPFGTPTAECLRHISEATRRCFHTALTALRECSDATLEGGSCDTAARDATIEAARNETAAAVDAHCLGGQLTELRFADAADARRDMLLACDEALTTLRMIYAPALNPVLAPDMTERDRHCIVHLGTGASKLLMASVNNRSRMFNAAAVHIMPPSEKLGRFSAVNARLSTVRADMATRMASACAGAHVYDGHAEAMLDLLDRRSACVLSSVYFHTSVLCPTPVCGDGIVDSGEECDDGNGIDLDGCRFDCTIP